MQFHSFFFFNDTATTEIYTLSLHDALPIFNHNIASFLHSCDKHTEGQAWGQRDRKSTRLNSSHPSISYAVFCLKKKNIIPDIPEDPPRGKSTPFTPALYPIARCTRTVPPRP